MYSIIIYITKILVETDKKGWDFWGWDFWESQTGNCPETWRNTLWWPEIDPARGGSHSDDRKSTQDMAEHTLLTGNWPRTVRNTLCRPKNDHRCGRTHSADLKLTQDLEEHTLPTENWSGEVWEARSALKDIPNIQWRWGTISAKRVSALRFFMKLSERLKF